MNPLHPKTRAFMHTAVFVSIMTMFCLVACEKGGSDATGATPAPSTNPVPSANPVPTAKTDKPVPAGHGRSPICKNPSSAGRNSTACYTCVERECSASFNGMVSVCSGYFSCVEGCECSDRHCILGCVGKMDSACTSADVTKAQGKCEKEHCAKDCGEH
jgi:hypothetical protein